MNRQRKSIRLKNYDYSQSGLYFVTVCTQNRECLFGDIVVGAIHESPTMVLNDNGKIVKSILGKLSNRFPMKTDIYQIMPNHVHFVINIRAHRDAPLQRSLLSQIIGYFKMNSSKLIHNINPHIIVWQRNYYEHIVRTEIDLNKIRKYIKINPQMWERDRNNPKNRWAQKKTGEDRLTQECIPGDQRSEPIISKR